MIRRIDQDQGAAGTPQDAPPAGITSPDNLSAESPFHPALRTYSGPLDLLLYLINKNEIDIFDIPIAVILDQYLEYVQRMHTRGRLDLSEAGAFLVMATRLMEIKSRLLLPSTPLDDEEPLEEELDDPRIGLVTQLLEYKEIKERALLLEQVFHERQCRFGRVGGEIEEEAEETLDLRDTGLWDLCAAFDRVLEELQNRSAAVRVIEMDDVPLDEVIQGIYTELEAREDRKLGFRDLFRAVFDKSRFNYGVLISYFLALLEMARLRLIRIEQEGDFGEIQLALLRPS